MVKRNEIPQPQCRNPDARGGCYIENCHAEGTRLLKAVKGNKLPRAIVELKGWYAFGSVREYRTARYNAVREMRDRELARNRCVNCPGRRVLGL